MALCFDRAIRTFWSYAMSAATHTTPIDLDSIPFRHVEKDVVVPKMYVCMGVVVCVCVCVSE